MAPFVGRIIRHFIPSVTLWIITLLLAFSMTMTAQAAPFAAIVVDARSGEVLYEKNSDARLHPASLTKMMTLYITFQELESGRLSLDTDVIVSKNAASQPPSRLGLKPGQKIKVRYLIRAAALKSANDAAAALGDHIGGSEAGFAKRMTRTAKALGMRNSTFKNAHGLTREGHMSSARDMNILGRHLFYDFPQYYNIFSRRTADAGVAQVRSTNSRFLDGYEGADGIKTGYTVAAGFNLTASAKRGDKRIIATVFGSTSTPARNAKMVELMNIGFNSAKTRVQEKRPTAAPLQNDPMVAPDSGPLVNPLDIDALVAEAVEQPAGKTIRVSGAIERSLRPRYRQDAPAAQPAAEPDLPFQVASVAAPEAEPEIDLIAQAIAEGVQNALEEANQTPPPANTLQAQVHAIENPTAPQPDNNSLEAQALALAKTEPAAEPEQKQAAVRPAPRPPAPAPAEVEALAADEPAAKTPAIQSEAEYAQAEAEELGLDQPLSAIETVSAPANLPIETAPPAPTRRAPIFDPVVIAEASPETAEEDLVVVSKNSKGGRSWSISVGAYNSHYEAERALLKTGLAESSTLEQGQRLVTQTNKGYRASFLELTHDQAMLACRRIKARGQSCDASGPS